MSCQDFRESAAVDALGALDAGERARLAAHLDLCPSCAAYRRDLDRLPPLLDLAASAPAERLPSGLEDRIVQRYTLDAAPRRRRRLRWLTPAVAGLAIGVAATLAVVAIVADHGPRAVSVALHGTPVAPAATAVARLEAAGAGTVIHLNGSHLPASNANEHYAVWMSDGAEGVSAGTFRVGSDGVITGTLTCAGAPGEYARLDVTVEPDLTSAGSPRKVVLFGDIPSSGA